MFYVVLTMYMIFTEIDEEEHEYDSSHVYQAHCIQIETKRRSSIQVTVPRSSVQILKQ